MSRGSVAYAGANETQLLNWDAAEEVLHDLPPMSAHQAASALEKRLDSWSSSLVSVMVSYYIINGTPANVASPISGPNDAPLDPILKADLRDVFLKVRFRSTKNCGDLHYAELDLIQDAAFCLQAQELSVAIYYPDSIAADMPPPISEQPLRPPLKIFTTIGRGTMRNSVTPRRTIAAPIQGGGVSTRQRVPPWASTVFYQSNNFASPTTQITFFAGQNGPAVHSALIGKTPVSATHVPQGGLYFDLTGAADDSSKAVFTLQL